MQQQHQSSSSLSSTPSSSSSSNLPSVVSKRPSGQVRKAPSANLVNVSSMRQSLEDGKTRGIELIDADDDPNSHSHGNSNNIDVVENVPVGSDTGVDKGNMYSNSSGESVVNDSEKTVSSHNDNGCSETDSVKPLLAEVKRKGRLARTRTPTSNVTTITSAVASTYTATTTTTTSTLSSSSSSSSSSSTTTTPVKGENSNLATPKSTAPRSILKKGEKNSSPPMDALAAANLYSVKAELTSLKRSMSQTTPTKSPAPISAMLAPKTSISPSEESTPGRLRAGKMRSSSLSQTTPSRIETTKSANSTPSSNRRQVGKIQVELSKASPLSLPKTKIANNGANASNSGGMLHSKSLNVTPRIERSGGSNRSRANSAGILTPKPFPLPRNASNIEGEREVIICSSYERDKETGSILEELTHKKVEISPEKKPIDRKTASTTSSSSSSVSPSSTSADGENNGNHNAPSGNSTHGERPQNSYIKSRKKIQFVEPSKNGNISPKTQRLQSDKDKSGESSGINQEGNLPNISGNNRIIIQNEDLAKKNDAILQTKLQEAKAMNRKDAPGAAMFKFGLWNNVNKQKTPLISTGETGGNPFMTKQGQNSDQTLSQPKTPCVITDSDIVPIVQSSEESIPIQGGPTISISVTPTQLTRVVSEGSRFVNKFNQDVSMYAIPSPDGSQGSSSTPTSSMAAASMIPQVSGQPTRFRNLVDNAKHLGSVDTVSSLDTIDRADGYTGEDGTQFSFDEDDDYTADFSGPNTNTEVDDMLSIFSGQSIEGDSTLMVQGQRIGRDGNDSNPYARRTEPDDYSGDGVSAQPSISTSSNEVEEEDEVKKHFKERNLHASSSHSSISSEAGAASPIAQMQHDFNTEIHRQNSNNTNSSQGVSETRSSPTDTTSATPATVTRDPSYGSTASTKSIHGPVKFTWKKGPSIGEGSFGCVFRGINDSTGELIAIKQFCLLDGSEDEIEGFRREIETMESLEHRNIVRYFGTDRTDRNLFILMEFVPGGSIEHMLSQFGGFSGDLLRKFTHHILCGVNYLHGKEIIHRDIKGANVLVSSSGTAKLADFGCSKNLKGMFTASLEESLRAMKGSVQWMAPEVIKQEGCGPSSDIWSIGATIIEMATGSAPYSEFSNNLATLFHVATSYEPPKVPDALAGDEEGSKLLKRCLLINAHQRASAVELLQSKWFDGIDESSKSLLLSVTPRSS